MNKTEHDDKINEYKASIKNENKLIKKDACIIGCALVGSIMPFFIKDTSLNLFVFGLINSGVFSVKMCNITEESYKKYKLYKNMNKEIKNKSTVEKKFVKKL